MDIIWKILLFILIIIVAILLIKLPIVSEKFIGGYIDELINSEKIVVFSKTTCSYCKKAKELLDNSEFKYKLVEIDLDLNKDQLKEELITKTNMKTVPNIFIDGKSIGGYNELLDYIEKIK